MTTTSQLHVLPTANQLLVNSLESLLQQLDAEVNDRRVLFEQASVGLNALPLPTSYYAQAKRNLQNARDYLATGEPGAAQFELRSLLNRVKHRWNRDGL